MKRTKLLCIRENTGKFYTTPVAKEWMEDEEDKDQVKVPESIPLEFLEDVIQFVRMAASGSVSASVHGIQHQREMEAKWPREWLLWLYTQEGTAFCDTWSLNSKEANQ